MCSYQERVCDEPISSINCQSISSESCLSSDGQYQICLPNDDSRCTAYDLKTNCSQMSDNYVLCTYHSNLCVYENNECRFIECEDFQKQYDCLYAENKSTDKFTVFYWTGTKCKTATEEDIANFSMYLEYWLKLQMERQQVQIVLI